MTTSRPTDSEASSAPESTTFRDPDGSFFAPVKGSLAGIIALSAIGTVSAVVPFIAIVEPARTLLPGLSGAPIDGGRAWMMVLVAAIALFLSVGAAFLSGLVSRFADAGLPLTLRQRIIAQLQRLPLGWFDRRNSGSVRKLVGNDVVTLHQLVGHAIQDTITAGLVPVVSLGYLFWVQWQNALAACGGACLTDGHLLRTCGTGGFRGVMGA